MFSDAATAAGSDAALDSRYLPRIGDLVRLTPAGLEAPKGSRKALENGAGDAWPRRLQRKRNVMYRRCVKVLPCKCVPGYNMRMLKYVRLLEMDYTGMGRDLESFKGQRLNTALLSIQLCIF